MDLVAILADVSAVLNVGKIAVQVGADAMPYLEKAYELATTKTGLTDAERQALTESEAAMRASIDKTIADDDAASA